MSAIAGTTGTLHEVGFIFRADEIRAIDTGAKTQARRVATAHTCFPDGHRWSKANFARLDALAAWVDHGPSPAGNPGPYFKMPRADDDTVQRVYSRWWIGDLVFVREAIKRGADGLARFVLDNAVVAMNGTSALVPWTWTRDQLAARNMPKYAARHWLQITDVRAERLQAITEADARAEGTDGVAQFSVRWDVENKNHRWIHNPPCWVYVFRKLSTDETALIRSCPTS